MKIVESNVRKLNISGIKHLDPISVFLEDFEPRKGKITISCYDKSWNSYWGGMGDSTIAEFFTSCGNDYLAKNLSSIRSSVTDYESLGKKMIEHYGDDIDSELEDIIESMGEESGDWDAWLRNNNKTMEEVFGEEWWVYGIPIKPNPEYEYLCRILDTVKEALKNEQE